MPMSSVLRRGGVEQTQQQPLRTRLRKGRGKANRYIHLKSYFAVLWRAESQEGDRALKRAFVEGEKSSRQFCTLSCNRIMEQSKLNQFCND